MFYNVCIIIEATISGYEILFVDNKGGYLGLDDFALIDNRFEAIISKRCKLLLFVCWG